MDVERNYDFNLYNLYIILVYVKQVYNCLVTLCACRLPEEAVGAIRAEVGGTCQGDTDGAAFGPHSRSVEGGIHIHRSGDYLPGCPL